jgi:DNA (cytosine-5)-methyltransferase 1
MSTLTANDTTKALITPAGGSWNDHARPVEELRSLTTREAYALRAVLHLRIRRDRPLGHGRHRRAHHPRPVRAGHAEQHRTRRPGPDAHPRPRGAAHPHHQGPPVARHPGRAQAAAESMVDDCLFRMLEPHEVAAGMAFPGDYEWQPYTLKSITAATWSSSLGTPSPRPLPAT